MINIEFTPEKDGIVAGEENTFEVLLRASSDLMQPTVSDKKLPLNLALVLDRSGSMQGRPAALEAHGPTSGVTVASGW